MRAQPLAQKHHIKHRDESRWLQHPVKPKYCDSALKTNNPQSVLLHQLLVDQNLSGHDSIQWFFEVTFHSSSMHRLLIHLGLQDWWTQGLCNSRHRMLEVLWLPIQLFRVRRAEASPAGPSTFSGDSITKAMEDLHLASHIENLWSSHSIINLDLAQSTQSQSIAVSFGLNVIKDLNRTNQLINSWRS